MEVDTKDCEVVVSARAVLAGSSKVCGFADRLGVKRVVGSVGIKAWDFSFPLVMVPDLARLGSLGLMVLTVPEGSTALAVKGAIAVCTARVCWSGKRRFLAESHTGEFVACFFEIFLASCSLFRAMEDRPLSEAVDGNLCPG